jgi:SSS family solute:Na+ symporter
MINLHLIDLLVITFYLFGVAALGLWSGRKQKSMKEYFLASRDLPWYAVCLSVVATETSSLTFISVPGLAYMTNLNFLQIAFGYLIGRIIISFLLLPAYYRGELFTSYQLLSIRFGGNARIYASMIFQITRWLADGVRLFATAIPLSIMTGWSYPFSIGLIMVFTFVYTYFGGIRAVVWMDVVQMFIYFAGALLSAIIIYHKIDGGWGTITAIASQSHKFQIINTGFHLPFADFWKSNYTLISGLFGGAFLSMASHGTDQLMVQRLLSCRTVRDSQKALVTSGVFVIFQFLLFLVLGVFLFVYYRGAAMQSDEILPRFVIHDLPSGVSGIIIAGIFAAAMSTLSGSLNSLASSTMLDLYKPKWGVQNTPAQDLKISRLFTVGWTVALAAIALIFQNRQSPVVELGLGIASFTYGGMLGIFFLGVLNPKTKERDALLAMWSAIFFMTWLLGQKGVVLWLMLALNLCFGIWIFTRIKSHFHKYLIVVISLTVCLLIFYIPTIALGWPWYVVIGSVLAFTVGSMLTAIKSA